MILIVKIKIVILGYDTFQSVPQWITFIKSIENSIIVLCNNKIDLEPNVDKAEAEDLANKEGLLYFDVSAKSGSNIKKMFYSVISELPFFEEYSSMNKNKLIQDLGIIKL